MKQTIIIILMLALLSVSVSGALTDDNTLYYDFGAVTTDTSLAGSPIGATGILNGSIDFDGSSDYLDTSVSVTSGDVSAFTWVKTTSTQVGSLIDSVQATSNDGWALTINRGSNGANVNNQIAVWINDGSSTYFNITKDEINDGNWHLVGFTFNNSNENLKIYFDGSEILDTTIFNPDLTGDNVDIGRRAGFGDSYFDGNMDEVIITTDVLSSSEITNLYSSGTPTTPASQTIIDNIAYYNNMNTLFDWSGNSNYGYANGGDNIASGKIESSYNFDGSSDYVSTTYKATLPFTYNAWIYPETSGSEEHIIGNNDLGANSAVNFKRRTGQDIAIFLRGDGGLGQEPNTNATVGVNQWSMVTVIVNSSHTTFYINGTKDNSVAKTWTGTISLNSNSFVGARNDAGAPSSYFDGQIDEVGTWSRSLTESEISLLYNSGTGYNPYASAGASAINLIAPTNDSYLNVDDVSFNNVENITGSIDNTSIYINGILNQTNSSITSPTNQTFYVSGFDDGNYYYQITAFINGLEVNSSIYNFTIDTIEPSIMTSGFTNNQKFQGTGFSNIINLTGTVNIVDDNLYKVNISTQIETFYYNDSITTNELNLTLDEYIANYPPGKYTLNITATDGHTAKKIKDYRYNHGRSRTKKFDFNSPNLFLVEDFVEIQVNTGSMELIRELDRYKFDWKKTPFTKKPNSLTFTIKSDHYIDIPQNTDYAGHIIVPELNKWIDFEIEGEDKSKEDYIIERISDSEVQITITKFNRDAAIFRSIGDLNVNTVLFDFYVYNATETFDQIVPHGYSTEYVLDLNYDYEDYDVTLPVAILQINDTNYTATLQSNSQYASRFVYEYTMPPGNQDYNLTHKWHIDYGNLTNGIVTTVDQNQSIKTLVFGECIGNVTHPIAYFNYYDETDLSSIAITNAYSLSLVGGGTHFDVSGTFVNETNSSLCTNVDPLDFDVDISAYGSFTLSKTDYTLRINDVPEETPLAFSNSPPYNLSLYMVPFNESTTVTYSIRTTDFGNVDGTLQIYRCELDQSQLLIESVPIINGQAFANIELNTAVYAYKMVIGNNIYTSPTGWSRCHVENSETINLVVNVGDDSLRQQLGLRSIECTLTKTGNNTATLNWGPNPELETPDVKGCIRAYRMTVNGLSQVYNQCFTNPVYSTVVSIPANGNDYTVNAYLKQGTYVSECTQQLNFSTKETEGGFFGFTGLIATFFLLAGLTLIFAGSGENQLIALSAATIAIFFLQLLPVNWTVITSLIAILLMVIAIGRYARK
jgi:hypothetical protein